jgi:hypothetical protein
VRFDILVSVFVYLYGESKISARGGSVYGKMGGRKREAVYMARWVGEKERQCIWQDGWGKKRGSVYGKMGGRKREAVYMARWVGERERRRSLVSLFSRKNFLPLFEFVSHII